MKLALLQALEDVLRTEGIDLQRKVWDEPSIFIGQKHNRLHGGRHRPDREMATRHRSYEVGFLPETVERGENLARPSENALALRRDALKAAVAFDDGNAEFALQLTDPGGEGRLGDVATFGSPG